MSHSPYIVEATQDNFDQLVLEHSRQVPVVVDFWADWCAPCKMLMPVLTALAEEYGGTFILAKVNTDEQQALAAQYGVRSLPTVKVYKDGGVVDEFMGAQPASTIRAILDRHIERESDRLREQAAIMLEQGDSDGALELLESTAQSDPGNPRVKIDLARTLLRRGEPEKAEIVLDDLRGEARDSSEVKRLKAQLSFARIASEEADLSKLERAVVADPDDLDTRYRLAAHYVLRGDFEAAMNQLLEIMRRDRSFRDDAARKGLLAVFEILGGRGELVNRYRSQMFNILH